MFPDRLTSVRYFCEVQHSLPGGVVRILPHDSQACHFSAWIKFYSDRLSLAFGSGHQPDGERIQLMDTGMDTGTPFVEKDSRPGGFARHQWLAVARQHKNAAYAARSIGFLLCR